MIEEDGAYLTACTLKCRGCRLLKTCVNLTFPINSAGKKVSASFLIQ